MNGPELARIIDRELEKRGMSQKQFCEAIGVGSSAMSGWRNGSMPKPSRLAEIESFLGIKFSDFETETEELDDDVAEILQMLKDNYAYKTVCRSAMNLTSAKAFEAAAFIERLKEGE